MQDKMISSLAEILEEKSQVNYSDWEARVRKKIAEDTAPSKKASKKESNA